MEKSLSGLHGTAFSSHKAMIGAVLTAHTRFLEYVDGSIMTDGHFSDVSNTWIGDLIISSGNDIINCFTLNKDGNVEKCSKKCLALTGHSRACEEVICEKAIAPKDKALCLDADNTVPSKITLDNSVDIDIPVSTYI